MIIWLNISFGYILVLFTLGLHEFIHYFTLRMMGYDGEFLIKVTSLPILNKIPILKYSLAVRAIGAKNNIVWAKKAQLFSITPTIPTIILFIGCFSLFDGQFTILECIYGILLGLFCCSADLRNVYLTNKWWIKKNKNLVRGIPYFV